MRHSTGQRFRAALLSFMLIAFGGIVCAFLVMAYMRTPQARSQRNPVAPLVGTWVGEKGNIINIRSDGTGRARSSANDKNITYFEWTFDSDGFAIYQYSKKYCLGWFVRRAMMDDTPTERFNVLETTPAEFTLRSDTGDVIRFSSTQDIDLESTQ